MRLNMTQLVHGETSSDRSGTRCEGARRGRTGHRREDSARRPGRSDARLGPHDLGANGGSTRSGPGQRAATPASLPGRASTGSFLPELGWSPTGADDGGRAKRVSLNCVNLIASLTAHPHSRTPSFPITWPRGISDSSPSPCYLLRRKDNRMPYPQHPASQEQLAANRANAAKSTGPRTPQGKARSTQNARKHGFTASTFALVRLEDLQEVAHLKDDLMAVYQPVNSQELFAIERIALTQQALLRAARLESGLFTTCLKRVPRLWR